MREWFYLALGFSLLSILSREESRPNAPAIARSAIQLSVAVALLTGIDATSRFFLWDPIGRSDLASLSFFLWALLIDEGMNRIGKHQGESAKIRFFVRRSFLALVGFSAWTVGGGKAALLDGLGLPLASGLFEWLLVGLRDRLRLASIPRMLEGGPILFWLSMLLGLAFGFVN